MKENPILNQIQPSNAIFGEKWLFISVSHTCATSRGLRPLKIPYWGQSPQTPTNFYCIFRHNSLPWILCQKIRSIAQTVPELQPFKVGTLILGVPEHPCAYFLDPFKNRGNIFTVKSPTWRKSKWSTRCLSFYSNSNNLNLWKKVEIIFSSHVEPEGVQKYAQGCCEKDHFS